MRLSLAILLSGIVSLQADDSRGDAFAEEAADRASEKLNVRGDDDDWFFRSSELRHIATGKFWEKHWGEVAANKTDPVDSIVEFAEMLEERGIELLLVPIPAKAAIYPEKLSEKFAPGDPFLTDPFLKHLQDAGVDVLDLETRFRKLRAEDYGPTLYCQQDTHFSPAAAELVAGWIAEELGIESDERDGDFNLSEEISFKITGDQITGTEWEGRVAQESLVLKKVRLNGQLGFEPDDESPILLLGDSHTLVFNQGAASGMHTEGAGVFDHLSYRVGFPIALVGVRGSGLVQARKQLFYTATSTDNFWESKKAVVWMFSVREFTQSADRIVTIPLDRE